MDHQNKQNGFVTMVILILIIIMAVIFFAYTRVQRAQ